MTTTPPAGRIHHLDGLRGLAALVVVFYHYFFALLPLLTRTFNTDRLAVSGNISVCIFFVLSGFVLAQSAARTQGGLVLALTTRYLRLSLPMLASLVLAWMWLNVFSADRLAFQKYVPNPWLSQMFFTTPQVGLAGALQDGAYRVYLTSFSLYNCVVWTMKKELFGSIGVYLLYRLFSPRWLWIGGVAYLLAGLHDEWYLGFPCGIALRELWVRNRLPSRTWCRAAFGAALLLLAASAAWKSPWSRVAMGLDALAAGLAVLAVMTLPGLKAFFSSAVPQFLGRISFSLYLLHVPLLLSVVAWFYLHTTLSLPAHFALGFLIYLGAALLLAWIMTRLIDEPLVHLLHRLKKRRAGKVHPVLG